MSSFAGKHYHIVGVAGVGMNPLAQALAALGATVSGSDRFLDDGAALPVLDRLRAAGIRLTAQDGGGVQPHTAGVIVSTAIEDDNPDLAAAARWSVPRIHRAAMLAELTRLGRCVAVAGTSGKTTTTGMLGWILDCAGLRPSVVNGGAVINWRQDTRVGNALIQDPGLWVVETDESDRSFLQFSPEAAIITTLSADHFNLEDTVALFHQFLGRVSGDVIVGPGVGDKLDWPPRVIERPWEPFRYPNGVWGFRYRDILFEVPLAGRHNSLNAFLAVQMAEQLGVKLETARLALREFRGIERRLERADAGGPVLIYDDYGHNPEKIEAAWRAVAERSPRVFGVWRPHGFGPLAAISDGLVEMFPRTLRPEDRLYLLPVFYAGGTVTKKTDTPELAARLQAAGVNVRMLSDYEALERELRPLLQAGDALLVMGARDPGLSAFARKMATG
jgi:UDP-N-acetylmuramate--alanine ligase